MQASQWSAVVTAAESIAPWTAMKHANAGTLCSQPDMSKHIAAFSREIWAYALPLLCVAGLVVHLATQDAEWTSIVGVLAAALATVAALANRWVVQRQIAHPTALMGLPVVATACIIGANAAQVVGMQRTSSGAEYQAQAMLSMALVGTCVGWLPVLPALHCVLILTAHIISLLLGLESSAALAPGMFALGLLVLYVLACAGGIAKAKAWQALWQRSVVALLGWLSARAQHRTLYCLMQQDNRYHPAFWVDLNSAELTPANHAGCLLAVESGVSLAVHEPAEIAAVRQVCQVYFRKSLHLINAQAEQQQREAAQATSFSQAGCLRHPHSIWELAALIMPAVLHPAWSGLVQEPEKWIPEPDAVAKPALLVQDAQLTVSTPAGTWHVHVLPAGACTALLYLDTSDTAAHATPRFASADPGPAAGACLSAVPCSPGTPAQDHFLLPMSSSSRVMP